jgi:hypothetical protein
LYDDGSYAAATTTAAVRDAVCIIGAEVPATAEDAHVCAIRASIEVLAVLKNVITSHTFSII